MNAPEGKPEIVDTPTEQENRSDAEPGPLGRVIMEDQRLRLLQLLAVASGHMCNADVMQAGLRLAGHSAGHRRVVSACVWLNGQGLVEIVSESPFVARLTRRGLDVAEGCEGHAGIARFRPAG